MKFFIRYFLLCLIAFCSTSALALVDLTCLKYEPAMVTLIGVLQSKVYPGPPNYLSIADGDEPETGYYLQLKPPICTVAKQESWMLGHERILEVQLAVSKLQLNQIVTNVGHVITVKGTLFEAFDGHHHTPVLMDVQTFDGTAKPEKALAPAAKPSPQAKSVAESKKKQPVKSARSAKSSKVSKKSKASKQKKSKNELKYFK